MIDVVPIVEMYFAFWNEPDEARRQTLIAETFAADASYAGPPVEGDGREGIAALANQMKGHLAGYLFNRTSEVDAQHDVLRYTWEIVPVDGGQPLAAGIDFCKLDPEGRIQAVSVFLDVAPAGVGDH